MAVERGIVQEIPNNDIILTMLLLTVHSLLEQIIEIYRI